MTPNTHPKNQIILAPSEEPYRGIMSVFLAGITTRTDERDWREVLSESLLDLPLTVINPYRSNWNSTWQENIECDDFRKQVEWELEKQDSADIIVFYFHPATEAPISLLELGLCMRTPQKAIVVCPEGYKKRGNVQIVCRKYGLETVESLDALRPAIVNRMPPS
ncbi:hypothetical protein F5B19DRAFT_355245 [Rostrohypoxylon terebratum]|nr:hypothetical protein F5B19DRAFT_355245 [Rostrohypoxylon terebratum]